MPEKKDSVSKKNEDSMKASREAAQRSKIPRAECQEQHGLRCRSTQNGFKNSESRCAEDNTAPASNLGLILKVKHRQAMQRRRRCTAVHEKRGPQSSKNFPAR